MLTVTIPESEVYDDEAEEFRKLPSVTLNFEHSLATLSKWEEIWEKPFLSSEQKTDEETKSYIAIMCIDTEIPPEVFQRFSNENLSAINTYMDAKMSATWFAETKGPQSREIITAEIIYYWLISANIPLDLQHWHLNKLFTLIKVFNEKNTPEKKKMSKAELIERNREINKQRRAKMGTKG